MIKIFSPLIFSYLKYPNGWKGVPPCTMISQPSAKDFYASASRTSKVFTSRLAAAFGRANKCWYFTLLEIFVDDTRTLKFASKTSW